MALNKDTFLRKLLYWRPVRSILHASRLIVLPGFQGVPLFDAMGFFIRGLMKGVLNQRAASLSFHFFLALFPMLLFLFTLLPYIPIENLYNQIYIFLKDILPHSIYDEVAKTLDGIFLHKHQGLMSIGLLSSVIVASNGINAIILSFNQTYHDFEKRNWLKQRLLCIVLLIALIIGLIGSLSLILGYKSLLKYLVHNSIVDRPIAIFMLLVTKWILLIFFVYLMFAILYFFSPADRTKYKFFSVGATFATILFILTTFGFNFYINNFSKYNALYGSIGALIIFLLWVYINSFILLIGFELNASIAHASSQGYAKETDTIHLSKTAKHNTPRKRIQSLRRFLKRKKS